MGVFAWFWFPSAVLCILYYIFDEVAIHSPIQMSFSKHDSRNIEYACLCSSNLYCCPTIRISSRESSTLAESGPVWSAKSGTKAGVVLLGPSQLSASLMIGNFSAFTEMFNIKYTLTLLAVMFLDLLARAFILKLFRYGDNVSTALCSDLLWSLVEKKHCRLVLSTW